MSNDHWNAPAAGRYKDNRAEAHREGLTYAEAAYLLRKCARPRKVQQGQKLYHFSHRRHPDGFEGHPNMEFSTSADYRDVATTSIGDGLLYRHVCEVVDPKLLSDVDFDATVRALQTAPHALIEYAQQLREGSVRWYMLRKAGGVRIMSADVV